MKKWILYIHKNKLNGKVYVGITSRKVETRWGNNGGNYSKSHQLKFYNAIKKYGWNNFEHIVLQENISSLKEANELEKEYIQKYDSFKNGYNMTLGGDGGEGHIVSEIARAKLSEKLRGKESWIKGAPKEKTPMFGKHHSEETKEKMRKIMSGKKMSEEAKQKMRVAKLGKKRGPHSEETKEKIRNKLTGKNNGMYGKHTNNRPDSKIPIVQCDLEGNVIKEFESIKSAFRETKIRHIGEAIKGKYKKAGGFLWKKK